MAPSTCPPSSEELRSPVPLNAMYVVLMPASWFSRSFAAWFAEFVSAVERGEYEEDPERGTFLRKRE